MCLRELGLDRRAFGTHFLGSWRQDRADFLRELGELLAPRKPLQARPDQSAGRTGMSAPPRGPRPREISIGALECRMVRQPLRAFPIDMAGHVLLTYPFCGECPNCVRGSMAYCEQGFMLSFGGARLDGSSGWRRMDDGTRVNGHIFQQSSFASHTLATANSAVILDRDLPFNLAPAFGCGVSTGAGSVLNVMDLRPGSRLAILGAGTVGLAALMMARHLGVKQIIAVDTNPGRLETASELGATNTVDASDREVRDAIQRLTGRGADYIFDTTGHPAVVANALDSLAMTGTVVMAGAAPAGTRTSLDMSALLSGRAVRGTIQGDAEARKLVPQLIELYKQGRFPVGSLVGNYRFASLARHRRHGSQPGHQTDPADDRRHKGQHMNPANDATAKVASKRVHDPLVMPFSNVRHLDFRDKIRAAKLAGFGQLSLNPHETRDTIKAGVRPGDMPEIAAENDVAITRLDPLSNWNPRWVPANMDASYIDDFDIGAAEFFELCEQPGIKYCCGRTASGESGGVLASQRHSQRRRDRRPVFRVAARSTRRGERRLLTADTTSGSFHAERKPLCALPRTSIDHLA